MFFNQQSLYDKDKNSIHILSLSCNTVPPKDYGGIELVIAHLSEGLANIDCDVICYSPGELKIPKVQHYKTLPQPALPFSEGGVANTQEHLKRMLIGLKKNLKKGDVIILNHADHAKYLKRKLGFFPNNKYFICEIAHWIDVGSKKNIVSPSQSLHNTIGKPGAIIPHGEKLLFADSTRNKSDFLFFAGQITQKKGVDIALSAAKKLGVKLVLAGPLVEKHFSDPILNDDSVEYLGVLNYKELFAYYCKAKALVYMTQHDEAFGLAVIEAMAAGCPVITTGKGGTGETVIENETGYFCKTADDICDKYYLLNKIQADKCISRAKEYSIDKMAKAYLKYFQDRND